jgi:hypothetical protein
VVGDGIAATDRGVPADRISRIANGADRVRPGRQYRCRQAWSLRRAIAWHIWSI